MYSTPSSTAPFTQRELGILDIVSLSGQLWKSLITPFLLYSFFTIGLALYCLYFASLLQNNTTFFLHPTSYQYFNLLGFLLLLFFFSTVQFFTGVLVFASIEESEVSFSSAFQKTLRAFFPLLFGKFLMGIGLYFASILVIPGIMLGTFWSLISYTYLADNKGIIASFGRSMAIIENRWWRTYGRQLVIWIFFSISMMLLWGIGFILFITPEHTLLGLSVICPIMFVLTSFGLVQEAVLAYNYLHVPAKK